MSAAIYPGSFDPFTNGHADIVHRSLKMFDRVVLAVANNVNKKHLFTVEERLEMARECFGDLDGVEFDTFQGLLVDYARRIEAEVARHHRVQTPEQEATTNENGERERHLGGDQDAARQTPTAANGASARTLHSEPRDAHRRERTREDPRTDGEDRGEGGDPKVDRDGVGPGQVAGEALEDLPARAPREKEAERATCEREGEMFDQQLPEELGAPRTERQTERDLR